MSKNTTNLSDLPCTCGTLEQYVDGLCPGCIEKADEAWLATERALACDAAAVREEAIDLTKDSTVIQTRLCDLFRTKEYLAAEAAGTLAPPEDEGPDDRYYSGTGEMMGDGPDDDSYTRYLDRG
jgi:hypothetical protein